MADVKPLLKEDGEAYKVAVLIPTINNADELDIVLERLSKRHTLILRLLYPIQNRKTIQKRFARNMELLG